MKSASSNAVPRDHSGDPRSASDPRQSDRSATIEGWGADLDHDNRPAYPMERTPPRLDGVHWTRPDDQPLKETVYHSVERPGVTPVFGTSTPPTGISGRIRGLAYKLSENDIRHWLLLMLADRINVVEGLAGDLRDGHIPNIFAEMGIKSEWRHNRKKLVGKVAIASAIAGMSYWLLKRRKSGSDRY